MKWIIILSLLVGFAHAKTVPFEEKIKIYSYEELEKEIGRAQFLMAGSFVTGVGGVAGTIGFGYVTVLGVAMINSMHGQELSGSWVDVLIILTDAAVLLITGASALLTTGSIMLTEISVRNIIKQQNRLNNIRLEMVKFKPVSNHETSSVGIGISFTL